jgi:hypothetical protein
MRDQDQMEAIFASLRALWERHPELRLGQIVVNAASLIAGPDAPVFYVEDDKMLLGIERLISQA